MEETHRVIDQCCVLNDHAHALILNRLEIKISFSENFRKTKEENKKEYITNNKKTLEQFCQSLADYLETNAQRIANPIDINPLPILNFVTI